jgi:2-polyprenyl-3-methyl-5-hydroxy-6-metoxy-1,4-benzoquinol methylase
VHKSFAFGLENIPSFQLEAISKSSSTVCRKIRGKITIQMKIAEDNEVFLNAMIKEKLYSNKGNLQFHLDTLFAGIDFKNKKFLDIGGGSGLHSFYAACRGAKEVIYLEPGAQGSSLMEIVKFKKLSNRIKYDAVTPEPTTLQAFVSHSKMFDIILLHNSINHLDEEACINLLKDDSAKTIYRDMFRKIHSLSNKGAKLIICDCSRYNFFAFLGVRNPIYPTIEWHKHQAPEVWVGLLGDVGFENPKIRWSSFDRLRQWGKVFIGNKLMAYFLSSHFCLTMDKH